MATRACGRHCFTILKRRENVDLRRRNWRQAGIERGDRACIVFAHVGRYRPQRGMDADALLIFLQRSHNVAPALSGEIRNAGSDALAVEAVTALALLFGHTLARADV